MKLSDLITERILSILEKEEGKAEIQRNELAAVFGCVPSQINYVLTSRFTPEQGYIVESRRGGGGYIRISRVALGRDATMMHVINSVGDTLDQATARAILVNMTHQSIIAANVSKLISSAISDQNFREMPPKIRDTIRANILKNMLLTTLMIGQS